MYLLLVLASIIVGFYLGVIFKEKDIDRYDHLYREMKEKLHDKEIEIESRDILIKHLLKESKDTT